MSRNETRRTFVFLALLLCLSVSPSAGVEETPGRGPARLAERGEGIFQQKCSPCHSMGGGDRPTGPDLAGVAERRDRQWLARFIRDPGSMIAEKDPTAVELLERFKGLPMPSLGLSDTEMEALLAYLESPAEAEHHPPVPAPAAEPAGDPGKGRDLYTGAVPFAKGGAPCIACHGIAGLGPAGGASYGPELTSMYENYGAEGVSSVLESLPFPSMEPIYAARPLTEAERADLSAFLEEAGFSMPAPVPGRLALHAGAAIVILLAAAGIFGWRRLSGVRRPLVEQATKRKGEMR